MKIKYLELYKYKRFPLLGKDRLVIDFTHKLNLVLGANGSGKSSIVSELSPLPSSKEDFYENGYKCIVIEHQANTYTLISDIANNSYSFLLGEEELNPSHLVTIQRELVQKHFNLTQDIWDILTGKTSFTDMTLIQRKKLFNTLSHLNIETILDIYNEHKDQHKQQQTLLKTQSNLYTIEASKLLDPTLLDTLHDRLTRNNTHLEALMDIRSSLSVHLQSTPSSNRIEEYKRLRALISSTLMKHYVILSAYPYKQYETNKASIASKLDLCQFRLQDYYRRIESLETTLKSIELKKTNSKKSIEERLEGLHQTVHNYLSKLVYVQNLSGSTRGDIHALYYAMSDLVPEMPLNADKQYSKSAYDANLESKSQLLKEKQSYYQMQLHLTKEIDLLAKQKEDNQVTCPNCATSWVMDYDPLKHNALIERKVLTEAKLAQVDQAIETVDAYLTLFSEYMVKYRIYSQIRQTYTQKFPILFAEIDKEELIFKNPRAILGLINTAITDTTSLSEVTQLQEQILQLEKDLQIVSNLDTDDSQAVTEDMASTMAQITEVLEDKQLYTEQAQHNEISYKIATHLLTIETSLNQTQSQIFEHNLSYTLQKVITSIDTELNHIRLQNIETQTQISNHNTINQLIERYRLDIEDTTQNLEVLRVITEELNPKSGIIGRIISNYLNSIIEYVNKIIYSLWNYKMELVAYNLESDVLDYRFKINIEDKLSVKDISLASSGMKEIINLSFKLAMMKLLNLSHYPLYLDEFGARLDTEHKSNIYNLIFKFLSDDNYSQIYLITHTDLAYSNFKDTQVIQLS